MEDKQSIAIARALVSDAPILLMDEPTNSLDQLSESRFLQAFKPTLDNKTMLFFVTQKFSLLSLTPRVIVMNEARVYMDST